MIRGFFFYNDNEIYKQQLRLYIYVSSTTQKTLIIFSPSPYVRVFEDDKKKKEGINGEEDF